jgi:hypothetical protein
MHFVDKLSDLDTFINSQLTKFPPNMDSSTHLADQPNRAAQYETKLRDGDIIIAFVRCFYFSLDTMPKVLDAD